MFVTLIYELSQQNRQETYLSHSASLSSLFHFLCTNASPSFLAKLFLSVLKAFGPQDQKTL